MNTSGSAAPIVDVRDLRVTFGAGRRRREVVGGIDLRIDAGECVAIVGESGSGKSVTARSLIGLAGVGSAVTAGRLAIAGAELRNADERQWRRIRRGTIGFVLQDALGSLDPVRTIGAEITEALTSGLGHRPADHDVRVGELLDSVGVPDPELRARQYPHQLSGGLRQRALIASAIAGSPRLLIADEPTTALDVTVQAQILALLAARTADQQMALLLISHDLAVVSRIADRVSVMRDGRFVEHGPTDQVLLDPQHPYTRQLIAAVPAAHPRGTRLAWPATASVDEPTAITGVPDTKPAGTVLQAIDLRKTFRLGRDRTIIAAEDVSLEVRAGETVGLVGESGSGKSTVGRLLLDLDQPDGGQVLVEGLPWSAGDARRRRELRRRLPMIHQDPLGSFDPRYSVRAIIAEPLAAEGVPRRERHRRVERLLDQVGLASTVAGRRPRELSGGQRQRVAIARALAVTPKAVVCDEPASALDVSVQAQILDLLDDLQRELGIGYLFISHDLGVVRHVSDRILVMKNGRIIEGGTTEEVFSRPQHESTKQLLAAVPTVPVAP